MEEGIGKGEEGNKDHCSRTKKAGNDSKSERKGRKRAPKIISKA